MSNMHSSMRETMKSLEDSIGKDEPFILIYSGRVLVSDEEKKIALCAFKEAANYFD